MRTASSRTLRRPLPRPRARTSDLQYSRRAVIMRSPSYAKSKMLTRSRLVIWNPCSRKFTSTWNLRETRAETWNAASMKRGLRETQWPIKKSKRCRESSMTSIVKHLGPKMSFEKSARLYRLVTSRQIPTRTACQSLKRACGISLVIRVFLGQASLVLSPR